MSELTLRMVHRLHRLHGLPGIFAAKPREGPRRICHLTSVHPSSDPRIFYKECKSLVKAGYEVTLIAHHDKNEEIRDGVRIISFPAYKNRFTRILSAPWRMFWRARRQGADLYHFHDPELIFTGLLLRCTGAKVVFDIHENFIKQMKIKGSRFFTIFFTRLFIPLNYLAAKWFYLVLAENSYADIYKKYTRRYKIVLNMPDVKFFEPFAGLDRGGCRDVFYIGRVTKVRGIDVVLEALHLLVKRGIRFTMHIVGYIDPALKKELESLDYFPAIKDHIIFYGMRNLEEGYEIANTCLVGLSVLKPVENYLYSYSTKIFEYMAVGMPVITSNFELYKQVVEVNGCGICIDPNRPGMLADSIAYLLTHKDKALEMGMKGKAAAVREFNWGKEEKSLLDFYREIFSGSKGPVQS